MNKTGAEQSEVGCDDSNGNDDKEQERLSPSPHLIPSPVLLRRPSGPFPSSSSSDESSTSSFLRYKAYVLRKQPGRGNIWPLALVKVGSHYNIPSSNLS
jgi:hypothetical protein